MSNTDNYTFYGDQKHHPTKRHPNAPEQPEPYIATPELAQAVNLAIFLNRPLLLEGEAGCGKTRLAHRWLIIDVGHFPPNAFGLYDMHGNIWEWCVDPYLAPSYRRTPRNHAHLILLIDQAGSMMPFHQFTRDIVKTAQDSTAFVETFYFHNVPMDDLYTDAHLLEPIEIQALFKRCTKQTRILMISDAGAARGYRQRKRVDATLQFLLQLQTHTPHIGWLNPMPETRWASTSAHIIAHLVPMFEINLNGFSQAIHLLQGLQ